MIGRKRIEAALVDRLGGALALVPLGLEREVDLHDRVLLHDADQHDEADEGVDVELDAEEQQREQRAEARPTAGPERIVSGWMKLS